MRVRDINFFLRQLNSKNSAKNSGCKNIDELLNQELAEFYYFAEKKETKKVA